MSDLSIAEASIHIGVPIVQLQRWAWEHAERARQRLPGSVGPANSGTRMRPRYTEKALNEWLRDSRGLGRSLR